MSSSEGYLEYVKDVLEPFEPIIYRKMFGGYGIYKNGLIFAIILEDELYFKSDESSEDFYSQHNSKQFTYPIRSGKLVKMPYWIVPEHIMEDSDVLKVWFDHAYNIALSSKKGK